MSTCIPASTSPKAMLPLTGLIATSYGAWWRPSLATGVPTTLPLWSNSVILKFQ